MKKVQKLKGKREKVEHREGAWRGAVGDGGTKEEELVVSHCIRLCLGSYFLV